MPWQLKKKAVFALGMWLAAAVFALSPAAGSPPLRVTQLSSESAFDTAIRADDGKPVVVEFTAEWCAPCRQVEPIIAAIAAENPDIRVYSVDVDASGDLVAREGIRGIPYVAFYRQGRKVTDLIGLHPESHYYQAIRQIGDTVDNVAGSTTDISAAEARQLIAADNPFILDVRTPMEFQSGHIPDAVLIPVQQLAKRIGEIAAQQDRKVFVYCRSGNRSNVAAKILKDAGFRAIFNLRHGILEWQAAGYPITTPG